MSLTVSEFLDQFLTDYVETNSASTPSKEYRGIIQSHLKPSVGHALLSRLTSQDIQRYYAAEVLAGLSVQTVQHNHTGSHRELELTVAWE